MKKVLVVDNHPVILKFMAELLVKKGFQVKTAEDGITALSILTNYLPDVIFIDLVMPNISGEKLCRIIRGMPQLRDSYIVILSGVAAEKTLDCIELGANACIAKGPFDEMAKHILAVLDQTDSESSGNFLEKIIGLENIYEREITRELLSSQKHSETILNNISEGIIELTPSTEIVFANPAAVSLIGISEAKLLASDFTKIFFNSHRQRIKKLLAAIDDKPETITEESPITLNSRQISAQFLPIKDEDQQSIVVILKDITERKLAEKKIKEHTENLEEMVRDRTRKLNQAMKDKEEARNKVDRMKNELITTVAHQFRTPLTSILGFSEILMKRKDVEREEQKKFLSHINARAIDLKNFISTFLEVFQAEFGSGFILNKALFNLGDTVKKAVADVQRHAKNRQFEVVIPDKPLRLIADKEKIERVLKNILNNAVKFSSGGSVICLTAKETSNFRLQQSKEGIDDLKSATGNGKSGIEISIADQGIGMNSKQQKKIFDAFYRADTSNTAFEGIGLGMTIAKYIVETHNGKIWIESEAEKGTTVKFVIPV